MRSLPSRALLLGTILVVSACSSAEEREVAAKQEIEKMLDAYLPILAEAYSSRDPLLLTDWVAEKEIARIHKRIEELADQGRELDPEFHSGTVEDIRVWGNDNALVTTVEVWTIRSVALGTGVLIQEVEKQSNRVRYQMKRDDGKWRVLFRTIAE